MGARRGRLMTRDEFRKAVLGSQTHGSWALSPEPVSAGAVAAAESALGLALPADFTHVLLTYGAGEFHYLELLRLGTNGGDFVAENMDLRDSGVLGFVAFSPNGCGDF